MEIEAVGVIGAGGMGKKFALYTAGTGRRVYVSDIPEKRGRLEQELQHPNITICGGNVEVARHSDYLTLSVPAENLEEVLAQIHGDVNPAKPVGGQTSVKIWEMNLFRKYFQDQPLATFHLMCGPSVKVTPKINLGMINQGTSPEIYQAVYEFLQGWKAKMVELPNDDVHDRLTAHNQAAAHAFYLSLASAYEARKIHPWTDPKYGASDIDIVKMNGAIRVLNGMPHVYASIAMLNPYAKKEINNYSEFVAEIFHQMIQGDYERLKRELDADREVFTKSGRPPILRREIIQKYALDGRPQMAMPNSHLSLLPLLRTWSKSEVKPYEYRILSTPMSDLLIGITEIVFMDDDLYTETVRTAVFDKTIRRDDLEFCLQSSAWAAIINSDSLPAYKAKFDSAKEFHKSRIPEAVEKTDRLIEEVFS